MEELLTPTPTMTPVPTPTPELEQLVTELSTKVQNMELLQLDTLEHLEKINASTYLLTAIIVFGFLWFVAYLFYRLFKLFF